MIGDDLLRFKQSQKYLVWDVETESLNLSSSDLNIFWQNGYALYSGKKLVESHEDWVKWDNRPLKMGVEAARITQFKMDVYNQRAKDARPLVEAFLEKLFDENIINMFANGFGFDSYILQLGMERLGMPKDYSFQRRSICIQVLEKAIVLKVKPPKIGTDEWVMFCFRMQNYRERGLKTNLAHLCKKYEVSYDPMRHHAEALYDVELTKQVFDKQIYLIEI